MARVVEQARTITCAANDRLCEEDVTCNHIALVQRGMLRMQSHSLSGRRKITGLVVPGDSVGQIINGTRDTAIEAVIDTDLCLFESARFTQLIDQEPELRRALCHQAESWIHKARRLSWLLGACGPTDRLRVLLLLSRNIMPWQTLPKGGGMLTMLLPRQDIADLIATTQETVSRSLHQFQKDGLIDILNSRQFRLNDLDALAEGLEEFLES
ncbi:Crp/Fnr family transcriptional regulator [Thioclava sp. ES.031]|uniref:Crp/Fnr family transcriptional regulator n=1 Tax=Thioclava sp. ES.031 TaxID=1798203 RepID=UPI0015970362|nr:Crp/Fnr family transcriptional regulator [Thioclava sp. ES.031]